MNIERYKVQLLHNKKLSQQRRKKVFKKMSNLDFLLYTLILSKCKSLVCIYQYSQDTLVLIVCLPLVKLLTILIQLTLLHCRVLNTKKFSFSFVEVREQLPNTVFCQTKPSIISCSAGWLQLALISLNPAVLSLAQLSPSLFYPFPLLFLWFR